MADAAFAALGVVEPGTGFPLVSRVATAVEIDGSPFTLISSLSGHSKALAADSRASFLFGEPAAKGDPLTHPRITVIGKLTALSRDEPGHVARREFWLRRHPKSKLYIDFADFAFWRMTIERAHLNGGFGKAFILSAADMDPR